MSLVRLNYFIYQTFAQTKSANAISFCQLLGEFSVRQNDRGTSRHRRRMPPEFRHHSQWPDWQQKNIKHDPTIPNHQKTEGSGFIHCVLGAAEGGEGMAIRSLFVEQKRAVTAGRSHQLQRDMSEGETQAARNSTLGPSWIANECRA